MINKQPLTFAPERPQNRTEGFLCLEENPESKWGTRPCEEFQTLSELDVIPTRRRSSIFVRFLIAVLIVGAGIYYYRSRDSAGSGGPEMLTATLEKGTIKASVAATGGLEAITTVTVGSQVSAPVKQVKVDYNSPVVAGQILAILDPSQFEAKMRENEAGLELARADWANAQAAVLSANAAIQRVQTQVAAARNAALRAQSSINNAKANVDSAKAQVAKARAEMEFALAENKRYEQLFSRQLVAASDRDQKRNAYRTAIAGLDSCLASKEAAVATHQLQVAALEGARNDILTNQALLLAAMQDRKAASARADSAAARVKQSLAVLEQARVDVQRTILRAPITGTVIDRKIEQGQTVAAAYQAPELFKIARDLRQMQVRADVSEADIGKVAQGQNVTFTVDAFPDEKFAGKVNLVRAAPTGAASGSTQNNVVVYGVVISAPNPKLLLKPGMTATVAIETQERKDVLLVPDEALRFLPPKPPDPKEDKKRREREKAKGGSKKVAIVGRPGVVWLQGPGEPERRDLVLGVGDGKFTEVKDGDLKVGDKVYTKILDDPNQKSKMRISL